MDRDVEGVDADVVSVNNRTGMRPIAEHLVGLGHRRIGVISGPLDKASGYERHLGQRDALADLRILLDRIEGPEEGSRKVLLEPWLVVRESTARAGGGQVGWAPQKSIETCVADGVYEGLFTSVPLNEVGGSGSPTNALAIKQRRPPFRGAAEAVVSTRSSCGRLRHAS